MLTSVYLKPVWSGDKHVDKLSMSLTKTATIPICGKIYTWKQVKNHLNNVIEESAFLILKQYCRRYDKIKR